MIKRLLIFVMVLMILGLTSVALPDDFSFREMGGVEHSLESVKVLRVIDGDTLETSLGRVRVLGINTPEKNQPYYQEAKNYLLEFENKTIEIQRDKEDLDKYQRKLRYVFYEGRFVNGDILEQGLATSFMTEGLVYFKELIRAEEQAKVGGLGLWGESSDVCEGCVGLSVLDAEEEFFVIQNLCAFECFLDGWTVKDDANHIFKIGSLKGLHEQRYDSDGRIWNNAGDRFFMRDGDGGLVVFYGY